MTGTPIFGGSRKRRLTDRQLDALLRRYDWYWQPAPPIRWPWRVLRFTRNLRPRRRDV